MKRSVAAVVMMVSLMLSGNSVMAEEATTQLQEVVVTATKTERDPRDVTQTVTVITAEEIKKSGATSVGEAVNKTVGVSLQEYGTPGSTANPGIRGSFFSQVLVLLDGKRLNSPRDGGFSLSDVPVSLEVIERIEVVRGASSALYGADAMGGVVNVITKKPEGDRARIGVSGGSRGYESDYAGFSGRSDNLYYSLSRERELSDGYRVNSDMDRQTLGARIGYDLSPDSGIDLTSNYISKEIGLPGSTDFLTPQSRQWTRDSITGLGYRVRFSPGLDARINGSYNANTLEFRSDLATRPSSHESMTGIVDAQLNWLAGSWNAVTLGMETRADRVKSNDSGDHRTRLAAGYLQDEISIGEPLILVLGGRYDDHSVYGTKFSPRASMRYLIAGTKTIIRASAGKAFRAPTFNDLFWSDPWGNKGNPDLQPETSKEYDGGVEQSLGEKASVKITAFHRRIKNLIQWQQYAPFQYQPVNIGRAEIKGVEAEAAARPVSGITLTANYAYTNPLDEQKGKKIYTIPEEQLKASVSLALPTKTTVYLEGRRVKNYEKPTEDTWQYGVLNGKITQAVELRQGVRGEVFIGMNNICDRKYSVVRTYDFSPAENHTGEYPMPPREIFGGVSVQF